MHVHGACDTSAEGTVTGSTDCLSRSSTLSRIAAMRERFPDEHAYLKSLEDEVHRQFPDYCNSKEAVYMQIDGEYFAVKWPKCVRIAYDVTINVLQGSLSRLPSHE